MKKALQTIRLTGILCALLTLGGGVGGCGGGNRGDEATDPTSTRLQASWHLVKASGGIIGKVYPVIEDLETLTFHSDGTFTRILSGEPTNGTYTVTERESYLSAEKRSVITYKTTPETSIFPDVVFQLDSEHLVINEEAPDGYSREYERVLK